MDINSEFPLYANMSLAQGANCIIMNEENKILMILRDDIEHIKYPNYWCCPGGHVDPGETPLAAAKREVLEEVGFDVPDITFLGGLADPLYNGWNNYFFARLDKGDSDIIKSEEGQEARFVSYEAMRGLLIVPHAIGFIDRIFQPLFPKMHETRTPLIDFPNASL